MPRHNQPGLTGREIKFCAYYAQHFFGSRAVKQAGYRVNDTSARALAWKLLQKPAIQARIEAVRADLGRLHFDLANQATAKLARMLHGDPRSLYDAKGKAIPLYKLSDEEAALITGFEEVVEERTIGKRTVAVRSWKYRFVDPKTVADSILRIAHNPRGGEGDEPLPLDQPTDGPITLDHARRIAFVLAEGIRAGGNAAASAMSAAARSSPPST